MISQGEIVFDRPLASSRDGVDAGLVQAAVLGDHAAFDSLIHQHAQMLESVVRRLLADPQDAEDAIQETVIRAYQHLGKFRQGSSFRAWLARIAVNVCRDHCRTAWVKRVWLAGDWLGLDPPAEAQPASDPQLHAESSLLSEHLERALEELPNELRAAFILRYFEGFSGTEIAAALGCNESTVWSRIYTARRKLQRKLRTLLDCPPD